MVQFLSNWKIPTSEDRENTILKKALSSGVPQGGILSPIIFVIYGADMELWLKHSNAFTYADDTSSSVTGKSIDEVKRKLEEDADRALKFMASNGLMANPSKTTLMILNYKADSPIEISNSCNLRE